MNFFLRCFLSLLLVLTSTSALVRGDDELEKELKLSTLVAEGQAAPDFTCQATDGPQFTLSAQKGRVVVLYFFSTSVKASLTEMKYLETEVFQKLREREDFCMIALGRGHSREDMVKVGGENRLTFPLAADLEAGAFGRYFTKFVPRTVVVRRDGSIAYLATGYHEMNGIPKLQEVLAKELKVEP